MSRPTKLAPMPDWNDVRVFLAVARNGTVAKAAEALGVDQTTVGRRLASLEEELGSALVVRTRLGVRLTEAGQRILASSERRGKAAQDLAREAAPAPLGGQVTVRVATTDTLADAFVVPAIASLRMKHPELRVSVRTGWELLDLRQGDADIALRLVRPKDARLACRKFSDFEIRFYASRDYVAREGAPDGLEGQPVIAYEVAARADGRHPFLPIARSKVDLRFTANSASLLVSAARVGIGIVPLPTFIGDAHDDLVRVLPEVRSEYAAWLVVPVSSRGSPQLRVVREAIVTELDRWRRAAGTSRVRSVVTARKRPRAT